MGGISTWNSGHPVVLEDISYLTRGTGSHRGGCYWKEYRNPKGLDRSTTGGIILRVLGANIYKNSLKKAAAGLKVLEGM